jgi:S-adenosylmethionine/arginine decarboxylase-like enzyme
MPNALNKAMQWIRGLFRNRDEDYGYELQLDLYGCDMRFVNDAERLRRFVEELVRRIDMVAFGEFVCPHFGHTSPKTSGYSFQQWIETSMISGHVREANGTLYLNVFSCKEFDPKVVIRFSYQYFNAKHHRARMRVRH